MKYEAINRYCEDHKQEFDRELNDAAFVLLIRNYYVLLPIFITATLVNSIFVGIVALQIFVVPALFLILPKIVVSIWGSQRFLKFARVYVSFETALVLFALGNLFAYILNAGKNPDSHPPVEIALCIASVFTTYCQTKKGIVLLATFNAAVLILPLALWAPQTLSSTAYQFIGGYGIGIALAMTLHYHRKTNFFIQHVTNSLNYHLLNELESMVYPHQVKMIQNKSNLKETMHLAPGEGYMAEFDIINSSQIGMQDEYHQIKNQIFRSCYERMLLNYRLNEDNLPLSYSDAHLIKEMGDGFIYSVGYPFKIPEGRTDHEVAMELALDFIRIFNEQSQAFKSESRPCCVVVITREKLESFWTQFKINRYDFKQSSVTPVIRLQELRRELARVEAIDSDQSCVLIDEATYLTLSQEVKSLFRPIALKPLNLGFRGRPQTTHVYYHAVVDGQVLSQAG